MRRASRKDRNHGEIVRELERRGCVVVDVSGTACGCDLFAFAPRLGKWLCVEVKDWMKPPSARQLTDRERALEAKCRAYGAQFDVVLSVADALELVGIDVGVI